MKGLWNSRAVRRLLYALLLVATAAAASGCSLSKPVFSGEGGKLKVTATIGMITDIVRNVGGARVEAIGLMKAGVDPHLYKATKGDIDKLTQADVVFYNGLHLEGKMASILEKLADKKPTVAVSRNIDKKTLHDMGDGSGQYDPHIWFDVRNWMSATETVRDELIRLDPAHTDEYRRNADAYLAKLRELHEETKTKIASIPEKSRVLVTAHDAFGYFGTAYGIRVMGLQGISTASEAGLKDVSQLRDFLVENRIKAVFVESSVPKKTIQAVVDGAKEKGHTVAIGGELFSDAMGEEGTLEGTYVGMVRHNVDTIVNALK
ncbi:metal ABC transporter solute-binding protein, Zn/Mn family [Paenibacillus flagellatus]|uniref:Manganese transporter n=1 Tax=Paenibacillus flagellatus TaxID=2211139 RepID=A0A2V5K3Z7_9BACL|nr:zinc ABC transporter substrate-binding protein [Paenibacillus flagellatus]PYI54015.1 manganese transporter [Paenibacillus flagellatus]